MKWKIVNVILLAFLVSTCSSQNLRIIWEYPPDYSVEDSVHFAIFVWEGDSSQIALFDSTQLDSVGDVPFTGGIQTYQLRYSFTPHLVIRAAIYAYDRLGRKSVFDYTPFYGFPNKSKELKVIK